MNKRRCLAGLALVLAASSALAGDSKEFSMGIQGNARTEAADVGLPVYAGAVPYKEGTDDKAGVSLGAWAGGFGLQIRRPWRISVSDVRVHSDRGMALHNCASTTSASSPSAIPMRLETRSLRS